MSDNPHSRAGWPVSAEAREAVARALLLRSGFRHSDGTVTFNASADAVLAALQPIIAAEIRAWAGHVMGWDDVLPEDADEIASRICGGDR